MSTNPASAANGRKGGRPRKDLPCTCDAPNGRHRWSCPQKRPQYLRERRQRLKAPDYQGRTRRAVWHSDAEHEAYEQWIGEYRAGASNG